MTYSSDNVSLWRSNTNTISFDAGEITANTVNAYANLFYPYVLDNGGNTNIVSLTLDILNPDDLEENTEDFVNKNWVKSNRLGNNLSSSRAIWAFKEAFHGVKKSRAISNAICFAGQHLTFYIAPQGQMTGNINDEWLYTKTTVTVKAIDVVNGTETTLYTFSDFEKELDDSSRYFTWIIPSLNQTAYNNYKFFGLVVLRIDVVQDYYEDAERTKPSSKQIPNINQNHLQLLIYSGAMEIIEVSNVGSSSIVVTIPSYSDTLEQIFDKTVFKNIEPLNSNPLTSAQKRAIIADQIATIFISQHPVLTADFYPGKILGFGVNEALPPRKVIDKVITYARRYPDIIPMVIDRLFGMLATYKAFNFAVDIEAIISDFEQSSQQIRDPQRIILMDSDGVVSDDFGINGVVFNPYTVNVGGAETIIDVTEPLPVNTPLYDGLVGVSNIQITDPSGGEIAPSSYNVKISFDVDFGDTDVQTIRYSAWTQKTLNYKSYIDTNVLSRSHTFTFDNPIVADPANDGDVVIAQIDIEDSDGGVSSFVNNQIVYGNIDRPFLYDLKFYQRNDGSDIVDVYYSYRGLSEINNSYVYAQFSVDGGVTWSNVASTTLKGDLGLGVEPGRRRITWEPAVDLVGITVTDPILCRLMLYDVDANNSYGNVVTGALVMDLDRPDSALITKPYEDEVGRTILACDDTYTFTETTSFKLDCVGLAYIIIDGTSFTIGNANGHFVWDIDGDEHVFTYEGESIKIYIGEHFYTITYDGTGSLLFSIDVGDMSSFSSSSSSSSSSYVENWSSSSTGSSSSSSSYVENWSSSSTFMMTSSSSSGPAVKRVTWSVAGSPNCLGDYAEFGSYGTKTLYRRMSISPRLYIWWSVPISSWVISLVVGASGNSWKRNDPNIDGVYTAAGFYTGTPMISDI